MWSKYKNYFLNRLLNLRYSKTEGLPYVRDNLFVSILLISFPLCLLVYIPSVIFSLLTGNLIIAICDTIAMLFVSFILFYKNHSLLSKKILFSVNLYLLAFVLLLVLGTRGPGIILFICVSILSTLYISKKAGLISVAFMVVAYFFLIFGFSIKSTELFFFKEFSASTWSIVSLNIIAFNTILVLAVSFLVDQLQNSILTEHELQNRLKEERIDLLAAKLKSEESDRFKSAFLANMSHEIRTPLNGILGFADLLKESDLSGEQQQEYIRIIEKSGARMLNIINDIVDISKIEAGLMKLEMKESNINEQIKYIYTFFRPEIEAKGIKFSLKNTLSAKEAIIKTDREKLYAILTNLVNNSIKYTIEGSIEFGYFKKGDHLEFYVKDTGIGVQKDRQEAIFERFIQAEIEDQKARQGAGLGLAITKSYVEMLGGKIWIESEVGIGSTFYFTLPYYSEQVIETIDQQLAPSGKTDNVRKLKILIAEDDEVSEKLIDITVKKFGKEILKVRTGIEAVEACRDNPDINLILMDIQMPEMGGYKATRQIRQFNKDVIIIAQTAFGLSGDREKAIEAGCNDYIAKPIKRDELMELIQKYFRN